MPSHFTIEYDQATYDYVCAYDFMWIYVTATIIRLQPYIRLNSS